MRKAIGILLIFVAALSGIGLSASASQKKPGVSAEERLGEAIGGAAFTLAIAWLGWRLCQEPKKPEEKPPVEK